MFLNVFDISIVVSSDFDNFSLFLAKGILVYHIYFLLALNVITLLKWK